LGFEAAHCTLLTDQGSVTVTVVGVGTAPVWQTGGTLTFGSVAQGTSAIQTTNLVNLGAGIQLQSINPLGANAADFVLTDPPPLGTLMQGIQVLDFAFTPSTQGAESASYALITNAGTVNVNLSGTGVASQQNPPSALLVSEPTVSFLPYFVGVTSLSATDTLTATTNVDLQAINLSGPNAADFQLINAPALGPVSQGTQLAFQFAVTPSQIGAENATCTFVTNDGSFSISLAASGTNPLALSANLIAFGSTAFSATSSQTLTLNNLDPGSHIQLLSITSSSPQAADFPVMGPPPGPLAGGQTAIVFGFVPSQIGAESATYTINTSAGSYTVSLTGSGIAPALLSTAVVDMGSAAVGTALRQETIYLMVAGAGVSLNNITVSGASASDFTVSTSSGGSLSQGQVLAITIGFIPSQVGSEFAELNIQLNVPGMAMPITLQCLLTGVGL
jgi:hypothetical protein